jgi:hypothetical protein
MVTDVESSRGTEGTVVREREGDTIVSEGAITGENRSATFESVFDDGNYSGSIEGSEGGTGNIDRQFEDGEISGDGTFTKDGKTIESDVTRTAEGVQREFETSGGGQGVSMRSGDDSGFIYESGSGDVYAGRDGNVYEKTDDGWSQVQSPVAESAGSARSVESVERAAPSSGTQGAPTWAAASSSQRSNTSSGYDLNRDYQSRQAGYDRYSQHQSSAGPASRGRARTGRGRR